MDLSRRTVVLLAVVALVLGAGVAVAITGTVPVSDGVTLQAPDGMTATLDGSTDALLEEPFPTSGTVEWTTEAGNVSFFSSGAANATVHQSEIEGPWTNVTSIDADPNTVTIDPGDKSQVVVGNELTQINVTDDYALGDGTVDFAYEGATGQARVTIAGVDANREIVAVDTATDEYLDVATSTSAGVLTLDGLPDGEHDVVLQASDFDDPTLSNASPTGDLTAEPSDIEIDVNDTEFDNGDSVEVAIDLDGSQIHSETITANQTVTTAIPQSGQSAGAHDWSVTADPEFGNPTTESFEYRIPNNLTIRNETNHDDIIDAPIESDVTFFGEDQIVERSTDDGTINLTGLPVNDDFIAEIDPSDEDFTQRTIWFESIYQQQEAYLLNTSAYNTTEARFVLDDPTAQFGADTVLFIQRAINTSAGTEWQTVHADEFGAEGVTATLEEGQRYRLRIRSAEGTTQIVGPYRADLSETIEVQPGTPSIGLGEFEEGVGANAVLTNRTLEYRYSDPAQETDQVTVWIHEKGDTSNRLQANESYFNLGNFSAQTMLTENESEQTWVVNFVVDRDGEEFIRSVEVGNTVPFLPGLPEPWGAIVGIGSLLLLSAAFSQLNVATGAVVVAAAGGIMFFAGLLGGAATAAGITLGLFVAVVNAIRVAHGP